MKRYCYLFLMFLFLTCSFSPGTCAAGPCDENKKVSTIYVTSINQISAKDYLTLEDVKGLIKPLSSKFNLDSPSCTGFTNKVIRVAKKAIFTRSSEIENYLFELCSQSDPNTHDLESIGAISEQKQAAKSALEYIKSPTEACE